MLYLQVKVRNLLKCQREESERRTYRSEEVLETLGRTRSAPNVKLNFQLLKIAEELTKKPNRSRVPNVQVKIYLDIGYTGCVGLLRELFCYVFLNLQ